MKLIKELSEQVNYLTEENEGNKSYFIEGIFMQSDVKNRNNRVYKKPVLESAVDKYMSEQVNANRAIGELGHPDTPSINLDRVSHKITELRWQDNNVIGRAKIMDTPMGNIVKSLIDEGVQIGVSSRGLGTLSNVNGINEVNDDFMLSTVDIVADPSAPDAFVSGILEGKEWVWNGGSLVEAAAQQTKEEIQKQAFTEEMALRAFVKFLKNIK